MKNIVIAIIIFVSSWHTEKPDYISFEYSGNTDKVVDMIFISKVPLAQSDMVATLGWTGPAFDYIVDDNDFNAVKQLISNTPKEKVAGYYGYKIAVRENDLLDSCFVIRENSGALWKKMLQVLKANPKNKDLVPAMRYLGLDH